MTVEKPASRRLDLDAEADASGVMRRFRVYPYVTVSTCVEVDAEDESDAIDRVLNDGLPGLMFLDHTYPDTGDWECDEAVAVDD